LRAGEHVALRINCDGMGNMEGGHAMTQSTTNPAVWTLDLQLPMRYNETCHTGIFGKFRDISIENERTQRTN
jgi:hypothetical protein